MTPAKPPGTPRATRRSCRNPLTRLVPKDIWDPKWIGQIKGYPKSQETFEKRKAVAAATLARLRAEGRAPSRKGVRDGWGERKDEIKKIKLKAKRMAKRTLQSLIDDGLITDEAGNAAILEALVIVNTPSETTKDRLTAIKIVAEFTKTKPTTKIEATVSQAEAWLTSLASQK